MPGGGAPYNFTMNLGHPPLGTDGSWRPISGTAPPLAQSFATLVSTMLNTYQEVSPQRTIFVIWFGGNLSESR